MFAGSQGIIWVIDGPPPIAPPITRRSQTPDIGLLYPSRSYPGDASRPRCGYFPRSEHDRRVAYDRHQHLLAHRLHQYLHRPREWRFLLRWFALHAPSRVPCQEHRLADGPGRRLMPVNGRNTKPLPIAECRLQVLLAYPAAAYHGQARAARLAGWATPVKPQVWISLRFRHHPCAK